jgi:type II secretory pathway pseudopilin PulG
MQRVRRVPVRFPKSRTQERGYILLTLIFFVAVLAIGLTVILPSVIHEAKRDREEEMVHRGVQYSRAIRAYYKKFGRYPAKIEDLENTNSQRFLRQRYKDPITGEDFKLLRYGDPSVKLLGSGFAQPGGQPGPGQPGVGPPGGGPAGALNNTQGVLLLQQQLQQQQQQQAGGGLNPSPQQNPGDQNPGSPPAVDANGNPVANGNDGKSAGDSASTVKAEGSSDQQPAPGPNVQAFGGGAIVGVASTSRKETIREFNKKHRYSEWQFIFDPGTDRGGLITTPAQPQLLGGGQFPQDLQGKPGTPGQPGAQPNPGSGPAPNPPPIGDPQQ